MSQCVDTHTQRNWFILIAMAVVCACMQVLVPYLKAKLDNYHKSLVEQLPRSMPRASAEQRDDDFSLDSNDSGRAIIPAMKSNGSVFLRRLKQLQLLYRLKKAFVKTYPFAHFAYEGTFFLYQVSKSSNLAGVLMFVWRL